MSSHKLIALTLCFVLAALAFSVHLAVAMPATQEGEPFKPVELDASEQIVVLDVSEVLTASQELSSMEPAAVIMSQGFEGAWPAAGWELDDYSTSDGGEFLWGKRTCRPRAGNNAGWSVGGGAQGSALSCSANYPNNVYTWATYGPFDLRGASSASLVFHFWGQTEGGTNCPYDYMFVGSSINNQQFNGDRYCGNWTAGSDGNGYYRRTLDLSNRLGQSQVWVAFVLRSDFSDVFSGVTIDDVTLDVANITPTWTPTPSPTEPTNTPTPTPTQPSSTANAVRFPVILRYVQPTPTPVPAPIWQWQRGQLYLKSVYFSDSSHGWAVGDYGMIVYSEDGGRTWRSQHSGVTTDLAKVQFVSNNVGWIVGKSGVVLHTIDGGRTWMRQNSAVTVDLKAMHFLNAQLGWIGLPDGLLKTTDGGITWSRTGSGISAQVQDIQFLNANTGLLVTRTGGLNAGRIMRSMDGGATWQNATCNYTWGCGQIWALYMATQSSGAAVGGHVDPQIMLTNNGGLTWQPVSTSATFATLKSVFFVNATHGWALDPTDYDLRLMRTVDGGQSWTILPYANPGQGFHFASPDIGFLTGYTGVLATRNGGQTWAVSPSFEVDWWRDVWFVDNTTGWVVGGRGRILHTGDGGQTWEIQRENNMEQLNAVRMSNAQNGWAVGNGGKILATNDGGVTWRNQTANTDFVLNDVDFVDSQYGWIVGSASTDGNGAGRIWSTTDGGTRWNESAYFPGDRGVLGVDFVNRSVGYAVGRNTLGTGMIYKSTNGGASWTPVLSGNYAGLAAIACVDVSTCYAVGRSGTILRTTNGGSSWDLQASGTSYNLNSVTFLDRQRGYVTGQGLVIGTTDGGMTWDVVRTIGPGIAASAVAYPNAGNVWIVGSDGRIVAYR